MSDDQTIDKPSEGMQKMLSGAVDMCITQMGLLHAARAVMASTLQGSMNGVAAAASASEVLAVLETHMMNLQEYISRIGMGLPFKWENHTPEEIN